MCCDVIVLNAHAWAEDQREYTKDSCYIQKQSSLHIRAFHYIYKQFVPKCRCQITVRKRFEIINRKLNSYKTSQYLEAENLNLTYQKTEFSKEQCSHKATFQNVNFFWTEHTQKLFMPQDIWTTFLHIQPKIITTYFQSTSNNNTETFQGTVFIMSHQF